MHSLLFLIFALFAGPALSLYANNLNYRSPSLHHPSLGISVHKVVKRHAGNPHIQDTSSLNFTHGVASGDPLPHSVILWTRLAPNASDANSNKTVSGTVPLYNPVPIYTSGENSSSSASPVCVEYKVACDQALSHIVEDGRVYTSSDVDYTVKIEAQNLTPFTTYYYQFSACDSNLTSPVGRTKTTPLKHDKTAKIGLAVYSCSNYPFGFFNAVGNPARKDSVDYVLHLGDYIYEYANEDYGNGAPIGRIPQPNRTIYTLYDYRTRYATYRTDLDLLLSHQQFPWIPVWDDHEVADNTYRDGSSELANDEMSFVSDGGVSVDQRKMNAVRAYFEWMPLRQVDMDDNLRIWRSFSIGSLFDLIMLDTRQYDRSITDLYYNTGYVHNISNDAGRSMMGSRQENWFYKTLIASHERKAAWRVIGSQTVFSRVNESASYGNVNPLDYDAWDGYQANRNRTLQVLYDHNITNNIVISGDSHANWVSDLVWLDNKAYNSSTGKGAIGVEFAGTAISSPSPFGQNISVAKANNMSTFLVGANRELQWSETYYRGYFELHLTHQNVTAQYFGMPTINTRNGGEISLANFTVLHGGNELLRDASGGFGNAQGGAFKPGMGSITVSNITHDTGTNQWSVYSANQGEDTAYLPGSS